MTTPGLARNHNVTVVEDRRNLPQWIMAAAAETNAWQAVKKTSALDFFADRVGEQPAGHHTRIQKLGLLYTGHGRTGTARC
jgi:hypothetical protein